MAGVSQEYRINLPLSLEEYKIGQLYTVGEISKLETGGGEGIEVVTNKPFEGEIKSLQDGKIYKGQYTHKVIHLQSKVPKLIRILAPSGSLEIHEKCWNAFPLTRTEYSNPFMKDNFHITIDSYHDEGTVVLDNANNLSDELISKRQVVDLNIASCKIDPQDYDESEDPSKFLSTKTGRGQLQADWWKTHAPRLCIYKTYDIEFQWFGLQNKVQQIITKFVYRLLATSNRRVFCWIDNWFDMTMDDIRKREDETKKELHEMRNKGVAIGMVEK